MAGEGSKVDQSLRVKYFDSIPPPEQFGSEIERSNVPAVLRGAVKEWDAITKWDPCNGGLDYLQERVGSNTVEAMLSKSAPVFYGDLRSHERVPISFSEFIQSCKSCQNNNGERKFGDVGQEPCGSIANVLDEDHSSLNDKLGSHQVYLAQVPILNVENKEGSALLVLWDDLKMPTSLNSKPLVSINFWMNATRSRSSTHYDPHNNLLCVVAGRKTVCLWSPSVSPLLYPLPVYGEASNHSAVDIEKPDLLLHPRAKHSVEFSQKTILQAGDALFIPEGWFHQVDSDDLTIAVNFWWQSEMMLNMSEHMDAYFLRRILNRLVGKEMDQMLCSDMPGNLKAKENHFHLTGASEEANSQPVNSFTTLTEDIKEDSQIPLDNLEPFVLKGLHELVSLVHHHVSQSHTAKQTTVDTEQEVIQSGIGNGLEDDPLASFLSAVEPLLLKRIILAMAHTFPRTLEALILHVLSPAAAEILTRKFDEMDKQTTREQQSDFYQQFYSAFDEQFSAMDALLSGKEAFAFQAFRNVLDQHFGVTVEQLENLTGFLGWKPEMRKSFWPSLVAQGKEGKDGKEKGAVRRASLS